MPRSPRVPAPAQAANQRRGPAAAHSACSTCGQERNLPKRHGGHPRRCQDCIEADRTVVLTCTACGRGWQADKSRGQYPRRCPKCTAPADEVGERALQLRAAGARATIVLRADGSQVVRAVMPWSPAAYTIVDDDDLAAAVVELRALQRERAAA